MSSIFNVFNGFLSLKQQIKYWYNEQMTHDDNKRQKAKIRQKL